MKNKRPDQILEYTIRKTEEIIQTGQIENNGVDAYNLSLDLKIDRANVSKELNRLWRQGALVKVQGKPVFYLNYLVLSERFPNSYIPSTVPKGEKITKYIDQPEPVKKERSYSSLDQLIGCNGSLSDQIRKAKAAVSYPPYGLHTIIFGNTGTGKTKMAKCMANYAIEYKSANDNVPFLTVNCHNIQDYQLFEKELFGFENDERKNISGAIRKSENGCLLLENVDVLDEMSLQALSSLIHSGLYEYGPTKTYELKTMIIATTTLCEKDQKIKELVLQIPIHIVLNDIDMRGSFEKMELIMACFLDEANQINIPIRVSKDVLLCLVAAKYENNIAQLRNVVKNVCSAAFFANNDSKPLIVNIENLSNETLSLMQKNIPASSYVSLLSTFSNEYLTFGCSDDRDDYDLFRSIPENSEIHRISQFVTSFNIDVSSLENIDDYIYENMTVLKSCSPSMLDALKNNIDDEVYKTVTRHLFHIDRFESLKEHSELLYGILLYITNTLKRLKGQNVDLSDSAKYHSAKDTHPYEYQIAKDIYSRLEETYSFKASEKEIAFLMNYLIISNQIANQANVAVLVITHGTNMAKEMVEFVRKSLHGNYFLDYINYSDEMQLNDCLELACIKCTQLNQGSGVVIAVDMEPLTTIGDYVFQNTKIKARTVYPISLPYLIRIIDKCKNNMNTVEEIASFSDVRQERFPINSNDSFIKRVVEEVIADTASFINVYKATDILMVCLNNTLNDLRIPYSNEIAIKYLCHCVVMLERVISSKSLDVLNKSQFISKNIDLVHIVEHNLEYAGNSFGVKIPQGEIAYVAQIFEGYL